MKTNESGRSMIEMLGVLAIIGVLSVGGISGYSKAMSVMKVNKTVDQLTQITASTRALFAGHKTYEALGKPTAGYLIKKSRLVPDEMITSIDNSGKLTMENAFGGSVTLGVADKGNRTDKAFTITYDTIPQSSCIELATKDWGQGKSSGLWKVEVNGAPIYNMDSNATDDSITVGESVTACNSPHSNTIAWTFY